MGPELLYLDEDMHKSPDEFEFLPNPISDYGVSRAGPRDVDAGGH